MAGAPAQVPPVLTASGLIIRTDQRRRPGRDHAQDRRPVDLAVADASRRARILSVAAFGDVVLATTSERELVAYSDAGVRLW